MTHLKLLTAPLILNPGTQDLHLAKTMDGFEGQGGCCENTWSVYRELRASVRTRSGVANRLQSDSLQLDQASSQVAPPCSFGAPLVAEALKRIGALDPRVDPASVTPAALPHMMLDSPAMFARPVSIRNL